MNRILASQLFDRQGGGKTNPSLNLGEANRLANGRDNSRVVQGGITRPLSDPGISADRRAWSI